MKKKELNRAINKLLNKPTRFYEKFHQHTKIIKTKKNNKKIPDSWKIIYYKSYPRLPQVLLPATTKITKSLRRSLNGRKSSRKFSKEPVSLEKLSTLLYFTFGLKDKKTGTRFYPSAGGRYPIEAYLISLNTEIPAGIYHYQVKSHSLELILPLSKFNAKKYFDDAILTSESGCIILISAVFGRTIEKYKDRGYRHILIETGSIIQNAYLTAYNLSLNICAIGGYLDDPLHSLLNLDGHQEALVGAFVCGED